MGQRLSPRAIVILSRKTSKWRRRKAEKHCCDPSNHQLNGVAGEAGQGRAPGGRAVGGHLRPGGGVEKCVHGERTQERLRKIL